MQGISVYISVAVGIEKFFMVDVSLLSVAFVEARKEVEKQKQNTNKLKFNFIISSLSSL